MIAPNPDRSPETDEPEDVNDTGAGMIARHQMTPEQEGQDEYNEPVELPALHDPRPETSPSVKAVNLPM